MAGQNGGFWTWRQLRSYCHAHANTRTTALPAALAAAVCAAGPTRLDYVLLTHCHTDHASGEPQLVRAIPAGGFIDHGTLEWHGAGTPRVMCCP